MTPAAWSRSTRRWQQWLAAAVAAVVLAADQVTKTSALHMPATVIAGQPAFGRHVGGTVYLDLTFNSGAAFGLGSGATPIVETVVVVLVGALLLAGGRSTRRPRLAASIGLGLIVGGALGNLSDRVFRHHGGADIDFLNVAQVNNHEYWPVFNLADAAIVVGAILLAYQYARTPRRAEPVSDVAAPNGTPDVG